MGSPGVVGDETFEATRDMEYTDRGATCNDYVDGELSHAVEVSGEVVNMRIPGTYNIQYDCCDLSGNCADPAKRTVVIQDTTCPKLSLASSNLQYVEAGFPYVDAGATATDTLDGDITQYIWTDGNTVNHKQAFYSRRSCAEIQDACKGEASSSLTEVCKSGEYYITTVRNVAGKQRFHRQLVHCWMEKSPAVTFKIFQLADCEQVHAELGMPATMDCHKQNGCELIGMKQNTKISKQLNSYIRRVKPSAYKNGGTFHEKYRMDIHKDKTGKQTGNGQTHGFFADSTYVCMEQDRVDTSAAQWVGDNVERKLGGKITNSEQGKYVIQFHASDKAGNHECKTLSRTVIVNDTLPPNLKGETLTDRTGPSGSFMAETVSSNGWIIGAVASAVAGVALLGVSSRSNTVSVPV